MLSQFDSNILHFPTLPGRILIPHVTQFFMSKWLNFSLSLCIIACRHNYSELDDATPQLAINQSRFILQYRDITCFIWYIIAKAVSKQNTSKLLLYKLYFNMILKSFDFQCDFDFQITTFKIILILNQLYFGDLILILKSWTYDDFAHLWLRWYHLSSFSQLVQAVHRIGYWGRQFRQP